MAKSTWVKINGTWRKVKNVWMKQNGVWKEKVKPKLNVSGIWKDIMSYGFSLLTKSGDNLVFKNYSFQQEKTLPLNSTYGLPYAVNPLDQTILLAHGLSDGAKPVTLIDFDGNVVFNGVEPSSNAYVNTIENDVLMDTDGDTYVSFSQDDTQIAIRNGVELWRTTDSSTRALLQLDDESILSIRSAGTNSGDLYVKNKNTGVRTTLRLSTVGAGQYTKLSKVGGLFLYVTDGSRSFTRKYAIGGTKGAYTFPSSASYLWENATVGMNNKEIVEVNGGNLVLVNRKTYSASNPIVMLNKDTGAVVWTLYMSSHYQSPDSANVYALYYDKEINRVVVVERGRLNINSPSKYLCHILNPDTGVIESSEPFANAVDSPIILTSGDSFVFK